MLSLEEIYNLILSSEGKIFSLEFIKKSTREVRKMTARVGVKKYVTGKGMRYDAKEKGLITLYDMEKASEIKKEAEKLDISADLSKAYRNVAIANIIKLKIDGKVYDLNGK